MDQPTSSGALIGTLRHVLDEYRRKGLARDLGFGSRPAVLVVDFIRGFTEEGSPLASNLDLEISATYELLEGARAAGVPVFFTTTAYGEDLHDAGLFVRKIPSLEVLLRSSRWVEIDPRLDRRAGEEILEKQYASAFFGTNLATRLHEGGLDTLLIAGCTTSGCIRASAVDALQNGFRAMVVLDCVGDRAEEPHRANLLDIQGKYGDVVDLKATLAYLESLQGGVPDGTS